MIHYYNHSQMYGMANGIPSKGKDDSDNGFVRQFLFFCPEALHVELNGYLPGAFLKETVIMSGIKPHLGFIAIKKA